MSTGGDDIVGVADDNAQAKSSRVKRNLTILTIVSSIVGLIAFAFAVTTYVHNRVLSASRARRTEMFLAATDRFTATLNEKDAELKQANERARVQLAEMQAMRTQLAELSARVGRTNELLRAVSRNIGGAGGSGGAALWDRLA